jgi:hypothetical protein
VVIDSIDYQTTNHEKDGYMQPSDLDGADVCKQWATALLKGVVAAWWEHAEHAKHR